MSDSLVVCEVDPELQEKLRKFRFRKETDNAAIIMKVDKDRQMYVHADGRVSYPLCFIFSSPVGCKPEQQMMYAGSKNRLVQTAELTKVFEIRTTDDLTEAWLKEKLSFFPSQPEYTMPSIALHCPIPCPLVPSQDMPLA
ncbi:GMFG [Cervus elaphus hippelaphus]|uniref:GMFG n=1 Tax=Cervus elaphus hippelaphus TaxID=46360 RepID=A0A212DDQ1_CEREH|nr:GMFG [Cervus elaphus hippelaphus]